jgi:hypothetical protein
LGLKDAFEQLLPQYALRYIMQQKALAMFLTQGHWPGEKTSVSRAVVGFQ